MTRPQVPISPRLDDAKTDRVVTDHRRAIDQLAASPAIGLKVIKDVSLADGVETPIPHGCRSAPTWVRESCVRGASSTGRIEEIRSDAYDRKKSIVLKATGWGATITVDVAVMP